MGAPDGLFDGNRVGNLLGVIELGDTDGLPLGIQDGTTEGESEGIPVGMVEGSTDGR